MNSKKKCNEVLDYSNEQWQNIIGHNGYQISDMGRCRHNYLNGKTKIIKPSNNGGGKQDYQFVVLNGKKYYLHTLVTRHFIGPKPLGYETDHINGQKADNRAVNLRYLTRSENRSHKGEAHPSAKLDDEKVRMARMLFATYRDKVNYKKIAAMLEVSATAISRAIRGVSWSHVL